MSAVACLSRWKASVEKDSTQLPAWEINISSSRANASAVVSFLVPTSNDTCAEVIRPSSQAVWVRLGGAQAPGQAQLAGGHLARKATATGDPGLCPPGPVRRQEPEVSKAPAALVAIASRRASWDSRTTRVSPSCLGSYQVVEDCGERAAPPGP